jgi:hypothetical protein
MKRPAVAVLLLVCALLIPTLAAAAQIRAYVAEFAVVPPDAAGLKKTLQTLLSSRMASEAISPVAAASEADVIISGSYTQLGKIFSLDAVAKLASGRTLATVFEQGESQDDLIPALGRISTKLKTELPLRYQQAPAPAATPQVQTQPAAQRGSTVWLSQRIVAPQLGLAPGTTRAEGREFFVAESHSLRLYRQEKPLKLLAEVSFSIRENVIAIDSAGPDQNGNPLVYVSIMDGEAPASKIFSFEDGKLKPVASNLPYLFRAIALNGGKSRIYAQQMGLGEDYFGDLFEVYQTGSKIELKNPIKMPRYGNVFNYNRVTGPDGKSYPTVLSTDGYLVVYSDAGEELWRSSEKFGGSETFFQRESGVNVRATDERLRWRFIDQRITVTSSGEIIVPQNAGFFVLGNNRSYSKYALVSFSWNGSSIEEIWRTKQSQNYMADYYLDDQNHEIVLLEVVQKEGLFSKGGSAIRVIRAN